MGGMEDTGNGKRTTGEQWVRLEENAKVLFFTAATMIINAIERSVRFVFRVKT